MRLGHSSAKRRQIRVLKIVMRDIHIEAVTQRLGAAVHRVVLGRGDHAQMYSGSSPCMPVTKATRHAAGQERVFAVGFLARAPSADRERC